MLSTNKYLLALLVLLCALEGYSQNTIQPVRIGVVGLVHSHVHGILNMKSDKFKIVGIAEPNKELAKRYADRYGFSMDIVFSTIDEMIQKTKPEGVTAFNTILGHLEVVEKCAPKGIHVMVEKPLAISFDHAQKIKALADRYKIHVLTNYETSWYATTVESLKLAGANELGALRKIIVHDGHQGPQEIGVEKEFLEWLIDPKYNGAGALTDFGCYGANLTTALMNGARPLSVTAVTQHIKPDKYPLVDDEATIILTYPQTQSIIQASWNWTFSRKDMEIYGTLAYIRTIDATTMIIRKDASHAEEVKSVTMPANQYREPFSFFAGVIHGEVNPDKDLSSLANNMIVVEILDAAMQSSKSGKTIVLPVQLTVNR